MVCLVDLTYAYSPVSLHRSTAKQCMFQIIGIEPTGTYRFITGFYGLSDMQIFLFKVDILIVTTGTKKDHLVKERDVL